jgi:hypothetical protein
MKQRIPPKFRKTLTDAGLFVALIRMHESHFALAPEGSRIVEALTVLAQSWIFGTLVDVLADVSISAESIVTGTLEEF